MKVYVDELPQNCYMCPCFDGNFCLAGEGLVYISESVYAKGRHKNCPLQSLTDYTKQVRKEVCEKLKTILNESCYMSRHNSIDKETLFKVLDQIQGE